MRSQELAAASAESEQISLRKTALVSDSFGRSVTVAWIVVLMVGDVTLSLAG